MPLKAPEIENEFVDSQQNPFKGFDFSSPLDEQPYEVDDCIASDMTK